MSYTPLPEPRLAEVITWAETEVDAFSKFPVSAKDEKASYLWLLCLAILTLRDKLPNPSLEPWEFCQPCPFDCDRGYCKWSAGPPKRVLPQNSPTKGE